MSPSNYSMIGVGIYTVPEAARLTGVSAARIRRWIAGYDYKVGQETHGSNPVWPSQLPVIDDRAALGFLDLMEIRFVDAFRRHGVSWKKSALPQNEQVNCSANPTHFRQDDFRPMAERFLRILPMRPKNKPCSIS